MANMAQPAHAASEMTANLHALRGLPHPSFARRETSEIGIADYQPFMRHESS
jgi:hypothetical protein